MTALCRFWRCRRGMLENDLVLSRFLDPRGATLTDDELAALGRLLDLSDNDLWEILSGRVRTRGRLARAAGRAIARRVTRSERRDAPADATMHCDSKRRSPVQVTSAALTRLEAHGASTVPHAASDGRHVTSNR